jgi:hypothetical protein
MSQSCRVSRLPVNPVAAVEKPRLAAPRGDRRPRSRRGSRARPRGGVRAGRGDLSRRGPHGSGSWRARRRALARRRLRRLAYPRHRERHERRAAAGLRPLRSTTCGTRSARASSATPTSAGSRSGWATPTCRRRCGICTTRRVTTMPPSSAVRSRPARTAMRRSVARARRSIGMRAGRFAGATATLRRRRCMSRWLPLSSTASSGTGAAAGR